MDPLLILFDVDGTLIDSAGAGRRAMERAFHEVFQIDGVAARTYGVRYAGMTDPVILESIASVLGIDGSVLARRSDELRQSYLRALAGEVRGPDPRRRVLPGVKALLAALDATDQVYLGLATGNFEPGARIKLEPFGLNPYFPGGGFSSDHQDRRELGRLAWRKLSALAGVEFPPARVVVVGDTEHDVDCAKANGFRAVAVLSGWVGRAELERAGPDVLLEGLGDMGQAMSALGIEKSVRNLFSGRKGS